MSMLWSSRRIGSHPLAVGYLTVQPTKLREGGRLLVSGTAALSQVNAPKSCQGLTPILRRTSAVWEHEYYLIRLDS